MFKKIFKFVKKGVALTPKMWYIKSLKDVLLWKQLRCFLLKRAHSLWFSMSANFEKNLFNYKKSSPVKARLKVMQKCAKKTVPSTAIVRNASTFTLKNATKVMMVLFFMALLAACAKEELRPAKVDVGPLPQDTTTNIINHWQNSTRSLFVNATAKDSLCHSDGIFSMYSTMSYKTDEGTLADMKMVPTASVTIDLTPAMQEVKSEAEIRTSVTSTKTITENLTNDGLKFNYHKHIQQKYADGAVADIHLRWSARGYVDANGDTLMTTIKFGAVKLDSISYVRNGEKTELYDPFKVTHHFSVPYYEVGVTGQQHQFVLPMAPYREKAITDDPETLITSRFDGKYVGCGETLHWEGTEYVKTNKREFTNPVNIPVVVNITAPEKREQPSLDSLFNDASKGSFKESFFSENTNEDGATIRTKIGTYVSKNTGKESKTNIESTVNFTYSYPTKYTSRWASYEIDSLKLSFAEGGFTMTNVSQDEDSHTWLTTNTVIPTIGTCELDAIDELVTITVAKEKKAIPVDSTYVWGGSGDNYIMNKTVIWSDGSKTPSTFTYDGHHSVSPVNFGEKITSSLAWNASGLKDNGTSTENDKKVFTPTTRFEVVYTTTNEVATATNNVESGSFGFNKTSPVVTFIDGQTKLTCPERKLEVNGQGATPAANYNIVVRDGVSYKGYTYNYTSNVKFDGNAEADVTSQGLLLMVADEIGDAQYKYDYVWNGNTITVTTTKTIPHTFADDEVETYTTSYTVSMTDLADGRVDADNVNFSVTATPNENALTEVKDGFYTISPRQRDYTYTVSNGSASRQMTNTVTDATISFNDGKGAHTWDASLAVSKDDKFGSTYADGNYQVTPLTTTVTAVASGNGAPTLSSKGVTSIYVQNIPVQYRLRYEQTDVDGGYVYNNVYAEKSVDGGNTWSKMDEYIDAVSMRYGTWKPNVSAQMVTSYEFTTDDTTVPMTTDDAQKERGTNGRFELVNTSKTEYRWKALFPSYKDADGNDKRDISGAQVVWVYQVVYNNPETGEPMKLDFTGKAETEAATHKVTDGVYTRIVNLIANGKKVDSQKGTVTLELQ